MDQVGWRGHSDQRLLNYDYVEALPGRERLEMGFRVGFLRQVVQSVTGR